MSPRDAQGWLEVPAAPGQPRRWGYFSNGKLCAWLWCDPEFLWHYAVGAVAWEGWSVDVAVDGDQEAAMRAAEEAVWA